MLRRSLHAVWMPVVFASAPAPARREPVVTNDDGTAPVVRASRPVSEMMHVAQQSHLQQHEIPTARQCWLRLKMLVVRPLQPKALLWKQ